MLKNWQNTVSYIVEATKAEARLKALSIRPLLTDVAVRQRNASPENAETDIEGSDIINEQIEHRGKIDAL